jgi:hypothetical protein
MFFSGMNFIDIIDSGKEKMEGDHCFCDVNETYNTCSSDAFGPLNA